MPHSAAPEPEKSPNAERKYRRLAWALIAALGAVRLATLTAIPLTGDEAYHWEWSRRLDWGYYDHPPMVAGMIRLFTEALGPSTMAVRLPAWLCLMGALLILWRLAAELFRSERAGLLAAAGIGSTLLWHGMATLITTDPPYLFFASAGLALGWSALTRGGPGRWLGFGVVAGLAMDSKFLGGVLWLCLPLAAVLEPGWRRWFRRWEPYAALAATVAVFWPVLAWNANHGFATFRFHSVVRHDDPAFGEYFLRFLVGQPAVYGLVLWPVAVAAGWAAWRRRPEPAVRFLAAASAPLLLFGLLSFRTEVGLHWSGAHTFALLALAAGAFAAAPARAWKAGVVLNWVLAAGLTVLLLRPELVAGRRGQVAQNKDLGALSSLYGWKELGERLVELRAAEGGDPLLLHPNYAYAAVASFYTPGQPMVWQFGDPSPYGRAYQFWMRDENWQGRDAIYFRDKPFADGTRRMLAGAFESFEELPSLTVERSGRPVRTWYFARCRGFRRHPWQGYIENPLRR